MYQISLNLPKTATKEVCTNYDTMRLDLHVKANRKDNPRHPPRETSRCHSTLASFLLSPLLKAEE